MARDSLQQLGVCLPVQKRYALLLPPVCLGRYAGVFAGRRQAMRSVTIRLVGEIYRRVCGAEAGAEMLNRRCLTARRDVSV